MFDLIEEELSTEKRNQPETAQFKEEDHPVVTMPTTYKRERRGGGGADKKLLFIIFGSLFGLAIIGTVVFLLMSRPASAPVQPSVTQAPAAPAEPETPSVPETPQEQGEQQPVVEPEKVETPAVPATPVPVAETVVPLLGIDADKDGLTDLEERLYSTNPQAEDTDSDSFLDGDEVKNLYDPLRGEQNRLDVSGLVNTYTNQTYQYALLYPSSWPAQTTDRTDRELMITSATGEFFTVTVVPNPNRLTPLDFYASQAEPGVDTSRLQSYTYDTWSGVMTENSLTVYMTRNEGAEAKQTVMYVMQYHLNTKNELNFIATMQMMLRSFIFTDLSFVK